MVKLSRCDCIRFSPGQRRTSAALNAFYNYPPHLVAGSQLMSKVQVKARVTVRKMSLMVSGAKAAAEE